jgi:hypothetical protein
MHEYETLRQRHAADAMRWAPGMIDRLDWSADRLAAYRVERLRAIVRHAVKHSPWHRDRLAEVDLGRLDGQFLRDIPPMTKSDLMGDFDQIVTDPRLTLERVNRHLETVDINGYLLDRYSAIASGGSSGERGAGRVRLRLGGVGDLRFVRDPAFAARQAGGPRAIGAAGGHRVGDGGPFHARHGGHRPHVRGSASGHTSPDLSAPASRRFVVLPVLSDAERLRPSSGERESSGAAMA